MNHSNRSLHACVRSCVATALAAALPAQDLRILDTRFLTSVALDPVRNRLVALGPFGDTLELHGGRWRPTAVPLLPDYRNRLVFDYASGSLLALNDFGAANSGSLHLHRFDGERWQPVSVGAAPPWRVAYSLAYDRARSELVLFGGGTTLWQYINDTWVFDGTAWHQRFPAASPPVRSDAPMVYDPSLGRVVLFGGRTWTGIWVYNLFDDTWTWDGAIWTQVQVPVRPPGGFGTGMAYDEVRQRTLMYHADAASHIPWTSQVYEFNGLTWQQAGPAGGLGPRNSARFVFDPDRGAVALFGGQDWGAAGPAFNTWEWRAAGWTPHPATPTAARRPGELLLDPVTLAPIQLDLDPNSSASMSVWDGVTWQPAAIALPPTRYEPSTCVGRTFSYVFGGYTYTQHGLPWLHSDLWGFDGTTWQVLSSMGPPLNNGAAIAFEWNTGNLVLFGGSQTGAVNGDTWIFDAAGWLQQQPAVSPPPRKLGLTTFDFPRRRVVLHGGQDFQGQRLADTWEWTGATWVPIVSSATPVGERLAFDALRGRSVLLSQSPQYTMEAWTLEPNGWQAVPLPSQPLPGLPLVGPAAIGFPYPHGLLLKDDYNVTSLSLAEARIEPYGSACTTNAPLLTASRWPRAGTPDLRIDVARAPANSFAALLGATQAGNVAVGGCTLLVPATAVGLLLPTSAGGFASAALPLPPGPAMHGIELFFQSAVLDSTAPVGFSTSRGLKLRIGV